ncbi:cyclopropane-fatty-acyl-phospholipid synthase family protein [Hibiscus syriacus]|uniref:Cyclopropane-fatty-acyl-phospholipid synthase family protein n=1 Tax=Hibiscus syriacus TaxID=106335 RepID=A0A6A3CCM3_HIBSY|nr:cyclopropane-fatty-acyl-phospholipid synthase family protein [Hibiscus syriacus]
MSLERFGAGSTKPSISTIGADQFDGFHPKERLRSYLSSIGGCSESSLVHSLPTQLLFTFKTMLVGPWGNGKSMPLPSDPKELYELDPEEYARNGKFKIESTPGLRFLNKTAVNTGSTDPWMLCSVTQVEETKQMLRMVPILIATLVPSAMIAQVNTLFVRQGTTLDRHMGNFKIPPASLAAFVTISMLISVILYDRCFVPVIRKWTKNQRGITLIQRMGTGLVLHIMIMVIASLTDRHRLSVAREHGLVEKSGQLPLTIFILLPQFVLVGTADAFLEVAINSSSSTTKRRKA